MPDFKAFDGSGRVPRDVQNTALKWLNDNWQSQVLVINAPVASGKAAIAKSIARAVGADIITPNNILVNQYGEDYPRGNLLKGKANYLCKSSGLSCADWTGLCGQDMCGDCDYGAARTRAMNGEPTTWNPASLLYYKLSTKLDTAPVIVVDEAHLLSNFILMMSSKKMRHSEYKFTSQCLSEKYLSEFLAGHISRLGRLCDLYTKKSDHEKLSACKREIESLMNTKTGLDADGQNYCIFLTKDKRDTYLNIQALFPPKFLVDKLLGGKKVILLSGTIFDYHVKELVGDTPYVKLDLQSPIPKDQRKILYEPVNFKMNYETPPQKIATAIQACIAKFNPEGNLNVIVHSTYGMSEKIRGFFAADVIYNNKDDKDERLQHFKSKGGVFLAAACSEGIDLKGDLCRLNIIPKIVYPNLGDIAVQRRKSLADGNTWFALSALQTVIQQAGRSTRTVDDWSITVILDPNYKRLYEQYKHLLPASFCESIVF